MSTHFVQLPLASEWERLKRNFAEKHVCHVPAFLHPSSAKLLETLLGKSDVQVITREYPIFSGKEHIYLSPRTEVFFQEIMAFGPVISFIRAISGSEITSSRGRLFELRPGDAINWHGDPDIKGRNIGFSLNVSPGILEGGVFQIRRIDTPEKISEVRSNFGDLHFFKADSDEYDHRVTRVDGVVPRRAYSGWFS